MKNYSVCSNVLSAESLLNVYHGVYYLLTICLYESPIDQTIPSTADVNINVQASSQQPLNELVLLISVLIGLFTVIV